MGGCLNLNWILDRLALGSQEDGQNALPGEISCLLNIGQHAYVPHPGIAITYRPIADEVYLPSATWVGLVNLLSGFLRRGEHVLVHCRLGKSRSPALVVAYLMQCGMGAAQALEWVKARHPMVAIHDETWRGMIDAQRGKDACPTI
jgi:hypothetical protein